MNSSYEVVKRHRDIPPTVEEIKSYMGAVTKECQYYLIGKICLAERYDDKNSGETVQGIYIGIGKKFGYSEPSMRRFAAFTKAIDRLQALTPEIVPNIFNGSARLSVENTVRLSNKKSGEILEIAEQLSDRSLAINKIFTEHPSHRPGIRYNKNGKPHKDLLRTVKDTPAYDPDAQISSLTYTVPTWTKAVERAFNDSDFSEISIKARRNLITVLSELRRTADAVIEILMEENR